jgi:hypothetical protein
MGAMVQLELVRTSDCDGILEALAASGLDVRRTGGGDCMLEVDAAYDLVETAVDAWILEHELPLVPMQIGESTWIIRPPGD